MMTIRLAKKDDVSKVSQIHAFCWRETYSFMPRTVLQSRNRKFRKSQWIKWFESQAKDEALFVVEADHVVVGLVKEIWTAGSPQWLVEVLWNNGVTGTYYARQLEVICK